MAGERRHARLSTPPPPLMAFERELFLRSIGGAPALGGVAPQLARAMRDVSFRAGETIHRAGDFTRLIHFVTHGEVELTTEGSETWRLVAPAVIGALDVNLRRPFSRTATALTDVRALVLGADDWFEVLDDNFEYASAAMLTQAADVHRLHLTLSPNGAFPDPPPQSDDDDAHALNVQERTLALRLVSCFQFAGIQALATLAIGAEERSLDRGQRLFTIDDPAPSFFVVARGTIRIQREDPEIRARFGPGSIVGGASAPSFAAQQYTAEAESRAVVLEIRREDLIDALEDHVEMVHAMFAGLGIERERIMNERARLGKLGAR
ncbi:MAG: cyclic nucleotide-binding domain-containing protein [Byssovorax sp.]